MHPYTVDLCRPIECVIKGGGRGQGRSRRFAKGDKPGSLGVGSPQRGPGAEYGNPREHKRGRDKN